MKSKLRLIGLSTLLVLAVFAACGGDGGGLPPLAAPKAFGTAMP